MKDFNYDWEHKKHLAIKSVLIIVFTIVILVTIWIIFKLITGDYIPAIPGSIGL